MGESATLNVNRTPAAAESLARDHSIAELEVGLVDGHGARPARRGVIGGRQLGGQRGPFRPAQRPGALQAGGQRGPGGGGGGQLALGVGHVVADRGQVLGAVAQQTPAQAGAELAGVVLERIEAHQARRGQWLQTHAGDLERHAALRAAIDLRRAELTAAAALQPPDWLVEAIGPYPEARPERRIWRDAAGDIAVWRERHGVTDQDHPLGPHPADAVNALTHRQLTGRIRDTARRLGHQPDPQRGRRLGIEHDQGFDLGL